MSSLHRNRPLSPHLQVYKVQITSLLSILHRSTGIVLFGGAFGVAGWFIAPALGSQAYEFCQQALLHPVGLICLAGLSFSFFYHLCNGIRHLAWDAGYGYEMPAVRLTGWIVIISALSLTLLTWILGLGSVE
jgi:succinate dehydrogenase / fumarate reductase cytochrome b subunit